MNSSADPGLASEIRMIRAIDNHAHPVRVVGPGEPPDRGFDALPVDNMEPQTDPVNLRPNAPAILDAWNALYGLKVGDQTAKQKFAARKEQRYPAWVLDQMGVEVMLANRVEMGSSIQPPRFRWVPYADALLFPLDNAELAARNSDRKSFFALEDVLRRRYLEQNKLERPPATLAGYLARVVTPTLEAQKQGGAVAEKFEAAYLRSLAFDKVCLLYTSPHQRHSSHDQDDASPALQANFLIQEQLAHQRHQHVSDGGDRQYVAQVCPTQQGHARQHPRYQQEHSERHRGLEQRGDISPRRGQIGGHAALQKEIAEDVAEHHHRGAGPGFGAESRGFSGHG